MAAATFQLLSERLWSELGGARDLAGKISLSGVSENLASPFEVGALASATVAVATLAAAELWSARTGEPPRRVIIDRRLAGASFCCERLVKPQGWTLPDRWDPIIGDYRAKDGWIRLHTNYSHHRDAAMRVLGVPPEKNAVSNAVARWDIAALESAVVTAGGAAAALRTRDDWLRHPQGKAIAAEPIIAWEGIRT